VIDWLVIYGITAGLLFRTIHHNRLVVPGMVKHGFTYWITESWLRLVIYIFILILGSRLHGVIPASYRQWWDWYFMEHSLGIWILTSCMLSATLYLLKEVSYRTNKDPHRYQMYDEGSGQPTFLRTSMKTPMTWFIVYWMWLLTSPWMPFSKCFTRIYLFGHRPAEVFPVSSYSLRPGGQMRPALIPDHTPPPASTNGRTR